MRGWGGWLIIALVAILAGLANGVGWLIVLAMPLALLALPGRDEVADP